MSIRLGNGLSSSQELEMNLTCSKIKVQVIDTDKLCDVLSRTAKAQLPKLKDFELQISGYSKLALYENGKKSIIFDTDLAGQFDKNGFDIELRRAPIKVIKEDGVESSQHFLFPVGSFELSKDELKKYIKEEVSLKDFMGERFVYNSRIVDNTEGFIEFTKEV